MRAEATVTAGQRPRAGLTAAVALWMAALVCAPDTADAQEPTPQRCADSPVVVTGADVPSLALACQGARTAFDFLGPLALDAPPTVPVHLVEHLPPDLRADAVGCYSNQTRRVHVLSLARFLARGSWFKIPVSTALYQAVVTHEVAHAIVGCHLGGRALPAAAHEYVAYVVMFATRDPATRALALAATPADGIEHDAEINDLRYAFDPMRFGVEAYRHWLRQADRNGFLIEVIRGGVVPEFPTY